MINWESILSIFDEKGTLLKWLQKVEEALNKSVLKTVTVEQPTASTAEFKFNFEDGTHIDTPAVILPAGAQGEAGKDGKDGTDGINGTNGADGVGVQEFVSENAFIAGDKTITPVKVIKTNGEFQTFGITAQNGANGADGAQGEAGKDGNGIVTAHTLSHHIEGNETITNVEFVMDEGANIPIEIHAQNGADGTLDLYRHSIKINLTASDGMGELNFDLYNLSDTEINSGNLLFNEIGLNAKIPCTGTFNNFPVIGVDFNAIQYRVYFITITDNVIKLNIQAYRYSYPNEVRDIVKKL